MGCCDRDGGVRARGQAIAAGASRTTLLRWLPNGSTVGHRGEGLDSLRVRVGVCRLQLRCRQRQPDRCNPRECRAGQLHTHTRTTVRTRHCGNAIVAATLKSWNEERNRGRGLRFGFGPAARQRRSTIALREDLPMAFANSQRAAGPRKRRAFLTPARRCLRRPNRALREPDRGISSARR